MKLFDRTVQPGQEAAINAEIAAKLGLEVRMPTPWASDTDKALALIGEHVGYNLFSEHWGGHTCELFETGKDNDPVNVRSGHGPTPSMAVCAAVLEWHEFEQQRIRESQGDQ